MLGYDDFYQTIERLHCLQSVPFVITYTDPEGDLLPINNNENYAVAIATARPLLRVHIQRKGMLCSNFQIVFLVPLPPRFKLVTLVTFAKDGMLILLTCSV